MLRMKATIPILPSARQLDEGTHGLGVMSYGLRQTSPPRGRGGTEGDGRAGNGFTMPRALQAPLVGGKWRTSAVPLQEPRECLVERLGLLQVRQMRGRRNDDELRAGQILVDFLRHRYRRSR